MNQAEQAIVESVDTDSIAVVTATPATLQSLYSHCRTCEIAYDGEDSWHCWYYGPQMADGGSGWVVLAERGES